MYIDYNYPNTKAVIDISVTEKLREYADETALDRVLTTKISADANETETYLTGGPFISPSTVQISPIFIAHHKPRFLCPQA